MTVIIAIRNRERNIKEATEKVQLAVDNVNNWTRIRSIKQNQAKAVQKVLLTKALQLVLIIISFYKLLYYEQTRSLN